MDVNERSFLFVSLYRRLAFIILCLSVLLPQKAICITDVDDSTECALSIINDIDRGNSDLVTQTFDHLETVTQSSDDSADVSRRFLESFILELNKKYSLNLTIREVCVIVKENINALQLLDEEKNTLLKTISFFERNLEMKSEQPIDQSARAAAVSSAIKWPWLLLLPNMKKDKHSQSSKVSASIVAASQSFESNEELPANVYIGSAEILAGALTCVIGTVFPPAYAVGVGLMMDGTRRICNDLSELDKTRQSGNQYSNPLSYEF